VSVFAIDLDLLEHGELNVVLPLGPFLDLSLCARLLVHKLIAGECKDLESLLAILLVQLNHFPVVHICQTSVRRNIHDHRTLLTSAQVAQTGHCLSIDVGSADVKQTIGVICESLGTSLLDTLHYEASHLLSD
jgi:hypothetical protein